MADFTTLPGMIQYVLNTYRNASAFNYRDRGEWKSLSTEHFVEKIRRLSLGLRAIGLKKGESVAILAKPSPYWLIIDQSIMLNGGLSVPLFPYVSQENFLFQIKDCDAKVLFVVGEEQWSTYHQHRDLFRHVITSGVADIDEGVLDIRQVMKKGDELSQQDPALFNNIRSSVQPDDVATIIYTSGSTGKPKGVELTHKNLISQVCSGHIRLNIQAHLDRAISVLPLAHVFERTLVYYYMSGGISIYFVDEIKNVGMLCQEVKPTICAMVPRLLEKIYAKMESKLEKGDFLKKRIGRWAFALAKLEHPNFFQKMQRFFAKYLVYSKLIAALGGNFRAIIVGGAALNPILYRFYLSIGLPVYLGYGLTETSPVISSNYEGHNRVGTVGPYFPGVEVSFSELGEILVRGDNVMKGYHNSPEDTAAVFDEEGWFHTGDKGCLDEENHLVVTGRIKEIFKTSGGKMVAPIPIEQDLCNSSLIDMAMVVAEGKRFVTCLLFPDPMVLEKAKEAQNGSQLSDEDFLATPFVNDEMNYLLKKVNRDRNPWEQVKKYSFVTTPLSVEGGELTPTLKIRRTAVEKKYEQLIETMYSEANS